MEFRNLNTFLKLASLQNFTRTAQELGYSQSNVSAQIKNLEQELGAPLFDRIGRNVHLTTYGEMLIPYAQQIVSTVLEIEHFSKEETVLGGTIRVGMIDSLFELLPESAFVNYHRRFPQVTVELTLDSASCLKNQLQQGLLDTACLIEDPLFPPSWRIWNTIEVPIVLVANPKHPFAAKSSITPNELIGQELILMESTAPYSLQFQQYLNFHHLECHPFLRLQSADTARRLVEQESTFISVLPLYTVLASVRDQRLCIVPLSGWKYTQCVQSVLYRGKIMTPQIKGFLEELQLVLTDLLAQRLYSQSI